MDYHEPVLLEESINGLQINPSGIYIDATYGGGGHSREILARLGKGKLIAFDQDEEAGKNMLSNKKFVFIHGNFRFIKNYLEYRGIKNVDGILADLGVSSHHFDKAERGFSFRQDGDLDMRMNTKASLSAAKIVNEYSEDGLTKVFKEYGELKNASGLATSIVQYRNKLKIEKTGQLIEAISKWVPRRKENQFMAKVFQALRIEVNKEILNLKELLAQSIELLNKGGRLVIISYHSLEDRVVKNFFRWGDFEKEVQKDIYGNYSVPFKAVNNKVIIPSDEEIQKNSRARSAKLRIGERI